MSVDKAGVRSGHRRSQGRLARAGGGGGTNVTPAREEQPPSADKEAGRTPVGTGVSNLGCFEGGGGESLVSIHNICVRHDINIRYRSTEINHSNQVRSSRIQSSRSRGAGTTFKLGANFFTDEK